MKYAMKFAMKFAPSFALAAVVVATSLAAFPACAQWMWKDEAGRVVVSDQPPPVNVPLSRIMKSPKPRAADLGPTLPPKEGPSRNAAKSDAPKSLADRDLEYKQRQKDEAETAKKADAEATKVKSMQENCTAVRGNVVALQSGGRAARVNEKGEKYYIDDAQRQSEIAKSQSQIAQYCK